jgi:hypothetical protein
MTRILLPPANEAFFKRLQEQAARIAGRGPGPKDTPPKQQRPATMTRPAEPMQRSAAPKPEAPPRPPDPQPAGTQGPASTARPKAPAAAASSAGQPARLEAQPQQPADEEPDLTDLFHGQRGDR